MTSLTLLRSPAEVCSFTVQKYGPQTLQRPLLVTTSLCWSIAVFTLSTKSVEVENYYLFFTRSLKTLTMH